MTTAINNALAGLVKRIVEEETEKAMAAAQGRIAAEASRMVVSVASNQTDHNFISEVNVVIHINDVQG